MDTSWFVEIRDEELIKFLEEQENPNTKKKTVYDVELFNNFIQTSNAGLQLVLQHLFTSFHHNFWTTTFGVGKKDGSDHEPTSFRGFLSSIQRYLNKDRTTASQFLLGRCVTCIFTNLIPVYPYIESYWL